jgi:molybdopterin molybdotransferase
MRDVIAPFDVPAHDNSAMDGYALRGADSRPRRRPLMPVAGTGSPARSPSRAAWGAGQCVRIMTGAVMPAGLDTVVPQEFTRVEADGTRVRMPAGVVRTGDNRRLAGEDLSLGRSRPARRRVIRPADLGLWPRWARPRCRCCAACAWPSSPPATSCAPSASRSTTGCVYDSNRYTLWGMLQRLGVDLLDMGVVRDDPAALARPSPKPPPTPTR